MESIASLAFSHRITKNETRDRPLGLLMRDSDDESEDPELKAGDLQQTLLARHRLSHANRLGLTSRKGLRPGL